MSDIKGLPAAIKLIGNLLDSMDREDAQNFAAFVLAKISHDSGLPVQEGLHRTLGHWAKIALAQFGDSGQLVNSGNCSCLADCAIRHTPQGPLVIHYGNACEEFRRKFPLGGPTRAQDTYGWNNWYASEKQDQPGTPHQWTGESSGPIPSTAPPDGRDESSIRFSLLDMT